MLKSALLVAALVLFVAAAPKKNAKTPAPAPVAPAELAHPLALFLKDLSSDGNRQVTFRATAVGTWFFFEETSGVAVYRFQNGRYLREEFLRGVRLPAAVKRYSGQT